MTGLFLSYLGSPGQWDLTDEAAVHRLVRTQFLAGVLDRPDRRPGEPSRPSGGSDVGLTDVTPTDPWQ